METRIEILNELKQISSFLVGMDKVNVFTVPPGYFDSVSETVMACLREDGRLFANAKNTLSLPAGYFENLAETILNRIKAQDTALEEIKDLSPLLYAIQNKNVFEVQEGYFEQLNQAILHRTSIISSKEELQQLSPMLYGIQNRNVFEVPEGYFEQLNQAILHRTSIISSKEELQELSPMLYGIQNKNVFEAPLDYFNTLPGTVINKVHPTGRVVSMWSRFAKYASAAVIVGAIAFGLYKYTDKPATSSTKVAVATLDPSIEKGRTMDDKQFAEALKNLTNADIVNYLEDHGDITDIATLGNNLDDALLPSQEEYLLDANTLDDFLYKIETTAQN